MNNGGRQEWIQAIRETSVPLRGAPDDYDGLLDLIGDAPLVLLGGATRGSYEFEHARLLITSRLIEEKNFCAVALGADWPSVCHANRYARGYGPDEDAFAALGDFSRFPGWVWRNYELMEFVEYLRRHNSGKNAEDMVGVYGLDRFSFYSSMAAVFEYLDANDPKAAAVVRQHCTDFEQGGALNDARIAAMNHEAREPIASLLERLRKEAYEGVAQSGLEPREKLFHAEQNAKLAQTSIEYYRALFSGRVSAWNLREHHMANSLDALSRHIASYRIPKLVVWAHNIHIGNALATSMSHAGQITMGQLAKKRYGREAVLVGFSTHAGTVTVADRWGGEPQRTEMRPAAEGSYEAMFHDSGIGSFFMGLRNHPEFSGDLLDPYPQRSIGAVYAPHREQTDHYITAVLPEQFDALVHFDLTTALEPLDRPEEWSRVIQKTAKAAL